MKKMLSVILSIVILAVALPIGNITASAATSGYYTYTTSNGQATIIDVNTDISGNQTIPSTLGGYPVTRIGSSAFWCCDSLKSITIPNGVTSIGDDAFSYCYSLKSITIPDSVTSIGYRAFSSCDSLNSITIPNSVTSIGNEAFNGCSNLSQIVVDENNTVYDSRDNCNAIIKTDTNTLIVGCINTIIPNTVTSIGDRAFYYCGNLTNITIPDSVTSIGDRAFSSCSNLSQIVVDENNTVYDSRDNCNAIIETGTNTLIAGCKNTIIPNTVTNIGNYAFHGCDSLTSITIPDSVTSIGGSAFYSCDRLTSITIGNNVTSIGDDAFYHLNGLKDVWYLGSEDDRNNISIGSSNDDLTDATWHYNACPVGAEHTFTDDCDAECNVCGFIRTDTHKVNSYNIINSISYPFSLSNGVYSSTNKADESSSTFTINVQRTGNFNIEYYTSTESNYDELTIAKNGAVLVTESGETAWTTINISVVAGDVIYIKYDKDFSQSSGSDVIKFKLPPSSMSAEDVDPTCEEDVICYACGLLIKEATGHNYSTECDTTCNVCNKTRSAAKHTYDNNCDTECNLCGATRSITHDYKWIIDKANNCGESGIKYEECTVCHIKRNENTVIPATGNHTFDNACDAECNVCGEIRTDAHAFVWVIDKQETCGETGTKHEECTVCHIKRNENTVIDATGNHSFEWVIDKVNNCGVDGIKHEECMVCYITRNENTVIDATGNHTFDNACDAECNVCGFIRTAPHDFEWVIDKKETCGETGTKHEECTVCHIKRNENTVIDATGNHSFKWVIDKENNCGVNGKKHEECTFCQVTRIVNVIPATGNHTFDNACDAECNVCGEIRIAGHTYRDECDRDCNVCGEFRKAPHKYDNECDDTCNLCSAEREVGDHKYTNACDAYCDYCDFKRTPSAHVYDNNCDKICNVCGETRAVPDHVYDNACDAFCNVCQAERTVPDHEYSSNCDTTCNVCYKIRENTPAHTYTNNCDADCNLCYEVRVPYEHKYANSCDADCNVCGLVRTIEHTFTDVCDNECNICFESRKAPHLYENNCDADCNLCGKTRVPQEHRFDHSCDTNCNECGFIRATEHTYSNSSDLICNVCYESLTPNAPTVTSKDATTITLVTVSGCEYSLDGINWQSSTTFSNLTPNTEYIFYQRVKETSVSKQSNISEPLKTKTLKGYTVTLCYNDGSGSKFTKVKTEGVTLSLGSISKNDYKFLGWSKTPNGTTFVSSYSNDADITFYAKWAYKCSSCSGNGYTTEEKLTNVTCTNCYGKGTITTTDNTYIRCLDCGSTNLKTEYVPNAQGYGTRRYCGLCGSENYGTGYKETKDCKTCNGSGKTWEYVPTKETCDDCNGSGKNAAPQPQAPKPTLKNKGANFVELENVEGAEYSINGVSWQASPLFSDLSSGTGYYFYQRYKESSINTVGEASAGLYVLTSKAEDTPPRLEYIKVFQMPNKLTYIEGEAFDETGMIVKAYYDNDTSEIITDYVVSGYTATSGTKTIVVSYAGKTAIPFTVEVLKHYKLGDLNGDGNVNNSDIILLRRFLAGWNVTVNEEAANLDGRGGVNNSDAIWLARHLAGWSGYELN